MVEWELEIIDGRRNDQCLRSFLPRPQYRVCFEKLVLESRLGLVRLGSPYSSGIL